MYVAEVRASSTDDLASDDAFAPRFPTGLMSPSVGFMMLLKLSALPIDIPIVRHGVATEIDTFF